MTIKIDVKFLIGLAVGALVAAGLVILFTGGGGRGDSKKTSADGKISPAPQGGGDQGSGDGEGNGDGDGGSGGGAQAGAPLTLPVPDGGGKVACPKPTKTVGDANSLQQALKGAPLKP